MDHDLFLLGHHSVPFLDLLSDPGSEGLADHGCQHVDDPLLGYFRQILVVRKVGFHLGLRGHVFKDMFEAEILILGYIDGLHLGVLQVGLLGGEEVLQEIDRGVV